MGLGVLPYICLGWNGITQSLFQVSEWQSAVDSEEGPFLLQMTDKDGTETEPKDFFQPLLSDSTNLKSGKKSRTTFIIGRAGEFEHILFVLGSEKIYSYHNNSPSVKLLAEDFRDWLKKSIEQFEDTEETQNQHS